MTQYNDIIAVCKELARLRTARQRKMLSGCCLHLGQPAMLEYIRTHPGCTQKETADHACVTPASIAASFKRLENSGLIKRSVDITDTRCNRVYITEAGERELNACTAALKQLDDTMLSGLNDAELCTLKSYLKKMIDSISDDPI